MEAFFDHGANIMTVQLKQSALHTVSYKRSFVIGCLLGDAHAHRADKIKGKRRKQVVFQVTQSLQQEDLVLWKAENLVSCTDMFFEFIGMKNTIVLVLA